MFLVGLDGHSFKVIELDGVRLSINTLRQQSHAFVYFQVVTEPYDATVVPLSVAQRASLLVTARNDTEADQHDWPLFANMNPDMFDTVRAYFFYHSIKIGTKEGWFMILPQVPDSLQLSKCFFSNTRAPHEHNIRPT